MRCGYLSPPCSLVREHLWKRKDILDFRLEAMRVARVNVIESPLIWLHAISAIDHPLPDNLDAERFVLGAIMSSDTAFLQVAGTLTAGRFQPGEAQAHFPAHERAA